LLSEKLLENAKAALDEVRQQADEINRLSQRVQELEHSLDEMTQAKAKEATKRQQLEEDLQHLKAENTNLADTLNKEAGRATSLQHEADRLRQKLVGPKTEEATPQGQERMAKLEAEVYKLRRSLESLWNIESQRDKPLTDEEDRPGKRWIWRAIAWLCAIALGGWLTATYLGLLP
jgi:uncharacterized phage infection (PIP) family protein YhgE